MPGPIKFYTDEHVGRAVIESLRRRGIDVLTMKDAGMLGAPDLEQINHAIRNQRVIFTLDVDFLRLHANGISHSGIVYASQKIPVGEVIRGLLLIYQVLGDDDMQNHVEFI